MSNIKNRRHRRGFTLIELIVVVVVLGILAAVATPKFVGTSDTARENAARQNLAVLRNALEMYRTENGSYPAIASNTINLDDYIRGDLPSPGVDGLDDDNLVATANVNPPTATSNTANVGWLYHQATGSIYINSNTADSEGTLFWSY